MGTPDTAARIAAPAVPGDGLPAGPPFPRRPEEVRALLAASDPDPATELGGPDPADHRLPRARRVAATALRAGAVSAHLGAIDAALRGQLRALAGADLDPVAALPKACVRAALPLCLREPTPGLVGASVEAARTSLARLEGGRALPRWLPDRRQRRAQTAQRRLHEETAKAVARHAVAPAAGPCTVLDHLCDDPVLARTPLPGHLLGTVTTASAALLAASVSWLLHELGERREDARRIRAEALARPTRLDGRDLATLFPYTDGFVREVLRIRPPAWLVARRTDRPVRLDGRCLPAGMRVSFSPYLLHRDQRWWAEPEVFAPERWLAPAPPHPPGAYLPFGAGCLGEELGTAVLVLAAAQLGAEYTVTVRHPGSVGARFGVVLRPTGLRVRLTRR